VSGDGRIFFFNLNSGNDEDFGVAGLVVRFLVNVAALWFAQWIIRGFDIDGAGALLVGAAIFGVVNAFIKPVVSILSCPLTLITLGLFTLLINALMLALTAWVAGWFDLDFEVDGFIAAVLGALVISIVSTIVSAWATRNVLRPMQRDRDDGW
jgi:putative membrane protein